MNTKNSNPKFTGERQIFHYTFLFDAYDIFYSVYNLHQIHFIEGNIKDTNNIKMYFCEIHNITWNGHQFLNTIRPKSVWEATKSGAAKLGIMSMSALSTISMKVAEAVVTNPIVIAGIIEYMK